MEKQQHREEKEGSSRVGRVQVLHHGAAIPTLRAAILYITPAAESCS